MNIIKSNGRYTIIQGDATLGLNLPVKVYKVGFDADNHSHYLTEDKAPRINEKIYGDTEYRVNKCLKSFELSGRNLGVILSGPKGSGKTVFAKMLAEKAVTHGYPFLIIDRNTPGLARFITSIEQPCVVFFDEFEKMFSEDDDECCGGGPQERLLPMFDGMMYNNKLFVIAVNSVRQLNDCLINRPGRFHYNFTFDNPSGENIRQYIQDNIKPQYAGVVDSLVSVSTIGHFSYDCLRAILFDINQGYGVEETLNDINVRMNVETRYELVVKDNFGHIYCDSVQLRPEIFMNPAEKQRLKFAFSCSYGDWSEDVELEASISNIKSPEHIEVPAESIDVWYMPTRDVDIEGETGDIVITDVYLKPMNSNTNFLSPVQTFKRLNDEDSAGTRLSIKVRYLTDAELKEKGYPEYGFRGNTIAAEKPKLLPTCDYCGN